MIRYAHLEDEGQVEEVFYKNVKLINCNNCEGPERKTCQEHNCCMGKKKECSNSCQCPNNKQEVF